MTPKLKATPFAVVNLIHCRLTPTRPISKRSPTLCLPMKFYPLFYYSGEKHLIR
ncbi:MAG: hypothetical protein LBK82_06255 [Planctomycetaceae bacterium]|nr:hypothetical protein [Planctomycetaceae bacterium]